MRNKPIALFFVAAALAIACQGPAPHDRLNGTWQSNVMTVTIDFSAGTYDAVILGQPFHQDLKLVKEYANIVILQTNGHLITCQFQDDGSILLTRQGDSEAIPVRLTRTNK